MEKLFKDYWSQYLEDMENCCIFRVDKKDYQKMLQLISNDDDLWNAIDSRVIELVNQMKGNK